MDALKPAELSSVNQLPQVKIPSKEVREWRSLIHHRQMLVARRTRIKNTIRAILDRQAIRMPSGKSAWTHAARKWQVQRVRSAPGVGPRLSEAVVAIIGDPHRFKPTRGFENGRQVAAYAGLVRRVFQSGAMDRKGGITGAGNRYLRSILVEVRWLGLRTNPWMKQAFDQVCRGCPSRRKIAIVAVARRLLIWCWAMMRDDQDWNPKPPAVA